MDPTTWGVGEWLGSGAAVAFIGALKWLLPLLRDLKGRNGDPSMRRLLEMTADNVIGQRDDVTEMKGTLKQHGDELQQHAKDIEALKERRVK